MTEAKSSVKQNEFESTRKLQKKSLLYSSEDVTRMAEQSSRAKLIKQVVGSIGTDDLPRKSSEKHYCKNANRTPSPENEVTKCKEYVTGITAYPSRVGLRWNPCVEVSSGEDIPIQLETQKSKNNCNCAKCTSAHCPTKSFSRFYKNVFRDNIMRFSDKTTITAKLNHAGCSARTPLVSPRASNVSLTGSKISMRCKTTHYAPPPPPPKSICKFAIPKGVLRSNYYNYEPSYDEAERDTDVTEDCSYLKRKYSRHCATQSPDVHFESGKINLYNEGIRDKVAERYPVTPSQCPHRVMFGARSFCGNMCPDCCCAPPSFKGSKYHQRCKRAEYNGPVYYDYDVDPDEVQHFVTIPRVMIDRYVAPVGRAHRAPSIILPKKMLTSDRDIEAFIQEQKSKRKYKKGR